MLRFACQKYLRISDQSCEGQGWRTPASMKPSVSSLVMYSGVPSRSLSEGIPLRKLGSSEGGNGWTASSEFW